jgi:hypothetical protein
MPAPSKWTAAVPAADERDIAHQIGDAMAARISLRQSPA